MFYEESYQGKRYVVHGDGLRTVAPCPPHCEGLHVVVTFYDENGKVIGCVDGGCSGESCHFDVNLWREQTEGISYRIQQSPLLFSPS